MEELLLDKQQEESNHDHDHDHVKYFLNKISAFPEKSGDKLGNTSFKQDYGLKYACLAGAMYRGIASKELVVSMGRAGLMGFLGTGGLSLEQVESDIDYIQRELDGSEAHGMNLIAHASDPSMEMKTVDLYLKKGVQVIEASAFMQITPALVYYRLKGMHKNEEGIVECKNKIIAKLSHPKVAQDFMSPAPERLVSKLLEENKITSEQALWSKSIPMANDICVEADSGGHTDQGVALVLLPAIQSLRKEMGLHDSELRIGLAGGIGAPGSVAAAFAMGADFILTGSINQCTVEAGISDVVKDLLQDINVQDTTYAPAGDMFEFGAKVQVLKKGVFFPSRANKLYMLYNQYNALEEIPQNIRKQIEEKYFKKSIDEIWQETKLYFERQGKTEELERAYKNPKSKMALVFRWYFGYSNRVAFYGEMENKTDFQVHTGPALGAFNQWVKGTKWENWRARHVGEISQKLMDEGAALLMGRLHGLLED